MNFGLCEVQTFSIYAEAKSEACLLNRRSPNAP